MTFIFRNMIIFWDIQNGIEDKQTRTEGVYNSVRVLGECIIKFGIFFNPIQLLWVEKLNLILDMFF